MQIEEIIGKSCVLDGKRVVICSIKQIQKRNNWIFCSFDVCDSTGKLYKTAGFVDTLIMAVFDNNRPMLEEFYKE